MGVYAFLGLLLQIFEGLAAKTSSKIDDQLVVLIKTILEDPAVKDWFDKLVNGKKAQPNGVLSLEGEIPPEIAEKFAAAGIGGDVLKQLLYFVLDLVLKWLKGQGE